MKKLKFLTLAAIAAATAMVSSCSDNDVLEGVKDTGIPFSVTASTNSGGSRGSDITTLSNFQLWGFGTDQTSHFDGNNFTPKAGSSTVFESSITPNWPNTNNCLFYGISNNTSTMAYGVTAGSPGVNTTKADIRNGSFDYTIPTNVADQEDLLVAAAQGNSAQGVNMHFDHALTAAKLHITMDPKLCETYSPEKVSTEYILVIKIKKIIIHNIKTSGTYSFGAGTAVAATSSTASENGSWNTSDGTLGDYVFDFTSNPLIYQVKNSDVLDEVVDIDGNGSNIYFIPQDITYWNIAANMTGENADNYKTPSTTESYIEIQAISGAYENDMATYLDMYGDLKDAGMVSDQVTVTSDDAGNYYDDGEAKQHMICNSDGFITDFSSLAYFEADAFPFTIETVKNEKKQNFLNVIVDDEAYAGLYKPFKATLGINGIRNLKLEVVNACRAADSQLGGSGAFGVAVEASTGGNGAKKY